MIRLDTNCLIRFFINDDKEKADLVENVIISNEVIAEIIYVLNCVYSIKKSEVVDTLLKLLENPNIYVSDKEIIKMH